MDTARAKNKRTRKKLAGVQVARRPLSLRLALNYNTETAERETAELGRVCSSSSVHDAPARAARVGKGRSEGRSAVVFAAADELRREEAHAAALRQGAVPARRRVALGPRRAPREVRGRQFVPEHHEVRPRQHQPRYCGSGVAADREHRRRPAR